MCAALGLMISLAIARLVMGKRADPPPPLARLSGFPVIFGVSNFISKCQHYLPGMVTPMKSKRGVFVMFFIAFISAQTFYMILSYTASFSFSSDELFDLYTLNFFKPFNIHDHAGDLVLSILGYYLALYPVFTLGTVFPIVSITLRENLKALARIIVKRWMGDKPFPLLVNYLLFPTLAVFPPLAIAFATTKILFMASITGAFLGAWLQYTFPATFVLAGKYIITKKLKIEYRNKYTSPFSHIFLLVFLIVWTVVSVLLVVAEDVLKIIHHTLFA